jgi:hypothetical protein
VAREPKALKIGVITVRSGDSPAHDRYAATMWRLFRFCLQKKSPHVDAHLDQRKPLDFPRTLCPPVQDFFVFDDLPPLQTAQASPLDRRDMNKYIFPIAALRLDIPITLLRVKPPYDALGHS